jgi:hypothetical protein
MDSEVTTIMIEQPPLKRGRVGLGEYAAPLPLGPERRPRIHAIFRTSRRRAPLLTPSTPEVGRQMGIFRDMWLVSSALAWFSDEPRTRREPETPVFFPPEPGPPIPPEILTPEMFQRWPPRPDPEPAAEEDLDEFVEETEPPRPGVPVSQFATGRTWYDCVRRDEDGEVRCQIRGVAFERKREGEMYALLPVKANGRLWLLRIEVINRTKRALDPWEIRDILEVVHPDGRSFRSLNGRFDFDEPSGARAFAYLPDTPRLQPGQTLAGGIVFLLPDEPAEYTLAVVGGRIKAAGDRRPARPDPPIRT